MSARHAVILAGGLATRMLPATATVPKWLLPVAGRPFAHWQLEWLAANGVTSAVCCIGHLGEQIVDTIGGGETFGLDLRYSTDGPELVGTAGALRLAADRGLLPEQFVVLYGDSYLPIEIDPVWATFHELGLPALMTVYLNQNEHDRSNASFDGVLVTRYSKQAQPAGAEPFEFIDYGLGCLDRSVLDHVSAGTPTDLASVYEILAERSLLGGHQVDQRFYEVGSPSGLRDLEDLLTPSETSR